MDIMSAILDIEQKVRGISDSTEELEYSYNDILRDGIKKKEDAMAERLKTEKEAIESRCFRKREEEMEKLEKRYSDRLERLDERCKKYKEEWVSTVVGNIIGM